MNYGMQAKSKIILALLAIVVTLAGCKATATGPFHLMPNFKNDGGGYWRDDRHAVFENESLIISLKALRVGDKTDSSLLDALIADRFVVFKLEILNTTEDKDVTYNPAHTTLHDNKLGLRKPMNLTDLYAVALAREQEGKLKSELRGKYYDTNVAVSNGKSVSKFLIFEPPRPKTTKVTLDIKLLYIGTDHLHLYFPFAYKNAEGQSPPRF